MINFQLILHCFPEDWFCFSKQGGLASIQLSMTFIMLITVKMPTNVGILTIYSTINTSSESLKARKIWIYQHFSFNEKLKFHAQLSWAWIFYYNLGDSSSWKQLKRLIFAISYWLQKRCTGVFFPKVFKLYLVSNWLYDWFFFDSLHPSQQFFSYGRIGFPGLNQY